MELDEEELEVTKNLNEKTADERIKLDFSINGEGRILMTAVGNKVYLDKIKRDTKLGEHVKLDDKDLEKVIQLNFYKVESVDILIEKLNAVKNNLILNHLNNLISKDEIKNKIGELKLKLNQIEWNLHFCTDRVDARMLNDEIYTLEKKIKVLEELLGA